MTKGKAIDLAAVREARANLRRIGKAHPELLGPPGRANRAAWDTTLEAMMSDETNDKQIVVRLPGALLERIDAFATKHRKETGENVTRSDAVRVLVTRALERPTKTKTKTKR